ncbi:MAG: efflux RND transporter permease subunit [Alphaproteobacteria bacterium]|nr:efflux RND transporter permease subunit [Alphaproteobacteria bacterium]NCQ88526.1 efflux RND transporter permease subunit [Alphaproteobacteria bacterium]NCT06069.1 efflux RND transporter permease subunit [Alphaproteobacteria bacterium]
MNNPEEPKQFNKADSKATGLIAWFADNHVAANILMFLFLAGGIFSVFNMRTETFPAIDPKLINVSVVYPGASPYEVADSITKRVEEALLGTEGVKRISSRASEGIGVVNVELEDFVNADDVYNDVDTAVNSLSDFPPADAERVSINKVKVTPNVLSLALHGNVSEDVLKYWAETIEDELKSLSGIALTNIRGLRDYEISIELSEDTLRQYNLSLQDIGTAIGQFSIDTPAGSIESKRGIILLRVQEKSYTGADFEKIVLRTLENGTKLRLGNIARINDGLADVNIISKFNGERAAFIDISRSESEDTLTVVGIAKDYLNTVSLPDGLNLSLQQDETAVLKDRINLMLRNAILGFMLVFLIFLLFLDLKLAFWTSAAIPISFLGGLMIMYFLGYSINMISLFALIVVLGIVVDDAIITGESIFEAQENDPNNPYAVIDGVKAVIAPVTIGVTTTMAAFAPLIFSTGTLGQIIKVIPVAVISILFISLIEAYFILPSHLKNPKRWSKGIMASIRNKFSNLLQKFIYNMLIPFARFIILWRYATLALFLGFAVITAGMFKGGHVRFVFFPPVESDEITITATLPEGSTFQTTQAIMLKIEEEIENVRQEIDTGNQSIYKSVSTSIGQVSNLGNPTRTSASQNSDNIGQIILQLVPSDFRNLSSTEIEAMVRKKTENLPNIETLEFKSSLIGEDADIEIELSHPDERQLNNAAEELKEILNNMSGTKEVQDTFKVGKPEYVFRLNDEGLAIGLTPSELGRQLRQAFFGLEAQRFQRGSSEIIVYVRYPKSERESLDGIKNFRIRLADGREVPLNSVADIIEQTGYSVIYSVDGKRIVSVTADVDNTITTPTDVMKELIENKLPALKEKYTGLSFSFEGESREQSEDLASLGKNMLVALMIIFVLLGAQLRSYIQPLIIMSAIPFGVIGAIWGHYLLGHDLSFISLFGIVALTGVVVNDSVVLMDFYNKQRNSGINTFDSLISAIGRRFRPILLTTLTTSLGLLPMLLETSMQARFLIPMVISLATGIIFATVIILFLIPCLVMIMDDIKSIPKRVMNYAR